MYSVMQAITADLDAKDVIAFIDWQHNRELANSLDVYGIPTLIIYAGDREVERLYGITSEAILRRYIETEKKSSLQRMNKMNWGME